MDKEGYKSLKERIIAEIDVTKVVSDEEVYEIIDEAIVNQAGREYLDINTRLKIRRDIFNSLRRMDVIQDYLENDEITEVMVNGPNNIFVEKNGRIYKTDRCFESETKLEDIIQRIAAGVNRRVNEAHPIVDVRLPDSGARVSIVLKNVALNGPIVTIRKFKKEMMNMAKLVELGTVDEEGAMFLELLVKGHYNILCSGGTGSGKTTMLNALARFIDSGERVVTVEDSAELNMEHLPNVVQLETRNASVEGKLEISIRDLIKASLRMRPDRLVVGEVRGAECIDMLQSLNTGHCGMSTAHANSPKDLLYRLETMVLLSDNIPLLAVRSQIASAVDVIVGVSRMRDSTRKITSICEVKGINNGEIELNPIYEYVESAESNKSHVQGRLERVGNLIHTEKLIAQGLEAVF